MEQQRHIRAFIIDPTEGEIYIPTVPSRQGTQRELALRGDAKFANEESAYAVVEQRTGLRGLSNYQRLGVYGLTTGYALEPAANIELLRKHHFTLMRRDLPRLQDEIERHPGNYDELDVMLLGQLMLAQTRRHAS